MKQYFLFLLVMLFSVPLHAASVDTEGVALITESGMDQARRNAIQDAVHQASLQIGAQVHASRLLKPNGVIVENSRIRATQKPANVSLVREWKNGDDLHVVIRSESTRTKNQVQPSPIYKKKVVVVPFHVYQPSHVGDIDDIWNGFPRELQNRLENTDKFLVNFSKFSIPAENKRLVSEQVSMLAKRIAIESNSQFVIAGEVLDAGITTNAANFFNGRNRRFEVQILLYDGLTGVLLARHKLSKPSASAVVVGVDKPFGSAAFFSTTFGQSVDWILDELTNAILHDVEHLPFTAQIVRISDRKIFFDAGATSLIAPGDTLAVYSKKDAWLYSGLDETVASETPLASVSVIQVQPLFSIGELSVDPSSIKIRTGDVVRFVSSH